MARVFVVLENSLGRRVVLKVLNPGLVEGVSVARFRQEIQLAAQLSHPHIVPVLSAGVAAGLPYYTMPYVEGESLRKKLEQTGALPLAEAVVVLRDVAKALVYAHAHDLVHRDIKPDNVLLAGGSAVVTDFGIAKAIAASRVDATGAPRTQVGTSLGTREYMAPEQPTMYHICRGTSRTKFAHDRQLRVTAGTTLRCAAVPGPCHRTAPRGS